MDHELGTLDQYIEEQKARRETRLRLRKSNQQDCIEYPSEALLNELDLSIKKNSAFVKRLKVFTENQKEQILSEIERLNLTKFISEVASSIIEAKFKLNDVPAVIEICTKLNQTYKDFNKHLLDQYIKYFPVVKRKNDSFSPLFQGLGAGSLTAASINHLSAGLQGASLVNRIQSGKNATNTNPNSTGSSNNSSVVLNSSKIRVDLRIFGELMIAGVFPLKDSFSTLANLLAYLMIYDKNCNQNASAILTFCKGCGDEFLGLVPRDIQALSKKHNRELLPVGELISAKRQELLRNCVHDYLEYLVKHLFNIHDELRELVIRNRRTFKLKGDLSKDLKELVTNKQTECQKVYNIVSQLAELLGEQLDNLPDICDEEREESNQTKSILEQNGASVGSRNTSVWDDEGTRSFYEDLLDLKTLFPNLVPKVSSETKKLESHSVKSKSIEEQEAAGSANVRVDNADSKSPETTNSRDSTPTKTSVDVDDLDKTVSSSTSEENLNTSETPSSSNSACTMYANQAIANRVQPEQYFTKLSNCVNRDMIDNVAIDFIRFFNTKFGRRKMVKTLFNVQRTRLDLLPFFSRLTATIHRYVPSIGNELVALLKQDFRDLFRKKDQINIESKVKNVRFIGELVKFGLFPKQEALFCLKMLLSDFTHHHIEMTCNMLETCGRLLFKSPDSHQQLRLLLEQMMRKKMLLSVDSKYITMIENAYYFTNPPELVRHIVEEPPVHIYVRYLLCECLNRSTIGKVLQKINKLNWNDKKLAKFVINCMIEAYNLKFYNIRYLAALLSALNKDYPWISVAVIDGVVEDILLMMEINELHFNQRRIPMVRYFGELYNYKLSDSSLVFKILYSLITYGVYYPEPEHSLGQIPMSQLDLPDNLFRIKLVCDLLETCGQYLSSSQEKKKLDIYLLFFQRYYWSKKHIYMLHPYCMAKTGNHFPASIEYLYNDAIFNLRPAFQMASSYSQAIQSVKSCLDGLIAAG